MNNLTKFSIYSSGADAITGERIFPGENVLDTNINNSVTPYMTDTLTRFVKESTIVWLAQQAGFTLTRSDARDSSNTEELGGEDVIIGGGETPIRNSKTRGKSPTK